jgi:hypothetical protein
MDRTELDRLLQDFWVQNSPKKREMCRRDNCGPTACEFLWFLNNLGIDGDRIRGEFRSDRPVSSFNDFTPQQRLDMHAEGLNPRVAADRAAYLVSKGLEDEHRWIPHYWIVVDGVIVDPVGEVQFVRSGLAADIAAERYVTERPTPRPGTR